MRVLALTPPGRFPSVALDTGLWWDRVADGGRHELLRFSANYAWWRVICSERFKALALQPLSAIDRIKRRAQWRADGLALAEDGKAASRSLDLLETLQPFYSAADYLGSLPGLAGYLPTLNRAQTEFRISIADGPTVHGLIYTDSSPLFRFSEFDSLLAATVRAALEDCPDDVGFVALSVSSPQDLLTALIAARALRERYPGVHVSLVDHGYENFSLHKHIESLQESKTLDSVFDTVIVSKDDRDDLVPTLIDAAAQGRTIRGYVTRMSLPGAAAEPLAAFHPPPPLPSFSPEPILWTRLSKRRCYWSRCTYCTQNAKYDDPRAPSRPEILRTLDRVEACIAAGYRYFYFSDEALSPSTLRLLAEQIETRGLKFRWACRCKLEKAHTPELFERLGKSGCYEILYGLETTSIRILKLMDKYVEGVDEPEIGAVFGAMEAAGIGIHVNLIGGYPGDTVEESRKSVDFLIREFSRRRSGTYVLNKFTALVETPLVQEPQKFGLSRVFESGDIAQSYEFELSSDIRESTGDVFAEIPKLQKRLNDELGWSSVGRGPAGSLALELYFGSGHGAIFKSRPDNPFANPLLDPVT
jgi:hypothetical protein